MKIISAKAAVSGYYVSGGYSNYFYNGREAKKDHLKLHIHERTTKSISALFQLHPATNIFFTEQTISPERLSFGMSPLQTILKKGIPLLQEKSSEGSLKHLITSYKNRLGKCTLQNNLHFVNGRLLYVHLCFTGESSRLQSLIYTALEEKYQCSLPESGAFVIQDSMGNSIKGNGGQEVNLYYLSGSQADLQPICDQQDKSQKVKERLRQRRLLSLQSFL